MTLDLTLFKKLKNSGKNKHCFSNINADEFGLLMSLAKNVLNKAIFVFPDEGEAQRFYDKTESVLDITLVPGISENPYSSIVQSDYDFQERLKVIHGILENNTTFLACSINTLHLKLPPKSFFSDRAYQIQKDQIIEFDQLINDLVDLGYQRSIHADEPGSFSVKGEIFDIFPLTEPPVRLTFFDTLIESIFEFDPQTRIRLKDKEKETVILNRTQKSILTEDNIKNFKNSFPRAKPGEKEMLSLRKEVFESLNNGILIENYQLYTDFFFDRTTTLLEFTPDSTLIFFNENNCTSEYYLNLEQLRESSAQYNLSKNQFLPGPESFMETEHFIPCDVSINELETNETSDIQKNVPLSIKKLYVEKTSNQPDKVRQYIEYIKDLSSQGYQFFICSNNNARVEELLHIISTLEKDYSFNFNYSTYPLDESFIYESEKLCFISVNDFFERKIHTSRKRTKIKKDYDLFAEQLATLKPRDFVIHKQYGVGKYLGIEPIQHGKITSDFFIIEYQDGDKVYVPVYKLDSIQKHSSAEAEVRVSNLKTNKFDMAKARARESVKKLAFSLLELEAKRKLKKGFQFSQPDHLFSEFCLDFEFTETDDQQAAIDNVIEDMTDERPMDRLVCGDVGFGKTEVAMRAAFKAVLDKKQVAILVPTTILALQHFNSFSRRFKKFPVLIEMLSRLKTKKQESEILEKLKAGQIDILVGTHKLLSSLVKFKDLGLLVIDEEQRFGVGHKEKLKLLRENIDTLTLTATPIPRTLQMSFYGIKELSLIKTAPPKRQSIQTYIMKDDPATLKMAIENEIARNGQVFIVHNKVNDIEIFVSKIRGLVPKARIVYAHGQLPERELEKRIMAFYRHEFDILIATTIIESGIDIPNANTMIIDRADTFGLSQLHQLRGRIGRSNKKAFAYFMIPKFKKLSDVSTKRLRALQTYSDLGSGFSIATSDLEIRGAGDILGPEQSGHISNIGLELYMELLDEAVKDLRGVPTKKQQHIEIQAPFNAYIPTSYIENSGERLRYYKQLSNIQTKEKLDQAIQELVDQYGQLTEETLNLLAILKSKINLGELGINNVKILEKKIIIKFNEELINSNEELRDNIIQFFTQRPKIYKINPDYSINCVFKDKIDREVLYEFTSHLVTNLK